MPWALWAACSARSKKKTRQSSKLCREFLWKLYALGLLYQTNQSGHACQHQNHKQSQVAVVTGGRSGILAAGIGIGAGLIGQLGNDQRVEFLLAGHDITVALRAEDGVAKLTCPVGLEAFGFLGGGDLLYPYNAVVAVTCGVNRLLARFGSGLAALGAQIIVILKTAV